MKRVLKQAAVMCSGLFFAMKKMMRTNNITVHLPLFVGAFFAAVTACAAMASPPEGATLVFRSGYEPGTTPDSTEAARILRGRDARSGFDWAADLDGAPGLGRYNIQYTGGTNEQRWARIIKEPGNPGNHVLWFNILEPNAGNGNGRVQSNLYGNKGLTEMTLRNRLFLHPDFQYSIDDAADWTFLTLFEFWNDPNWTGSDHPFRVALNLRKAEGAGEPLRFDVKGETDVTGRSRWRAEWRHVNTEVEVPVGVWMETELYIREGDAENGRIRFVITPADGKEMVIFDLTVLTHHPDNPAPDGFTHFNPQKLYTSPDRVRQVRAAGGSIQVYWDDFELWTQTSRATEE